MGVPHKSHTFHSQTALSPHPALAIQLLSLSYADSILLLAELHHIVPEMYTHVYAI